jgi:uncharacterized membrane protein YbhN (UPF0104 family)
MTRERSHTGRWIVLIVAMGAAVHLLLPLIAPLERSLRVARTLPPLLIAAAFACQVASHLGSGLLLRAALSLLGYTMSVARGSAITLASSSASLVAGGTIGFAATSHRWVSSEADRPEAGLLAGWLPPLLNGMVQLVLAVLSTVALILVRELSRVIVVSMAVLGGVMGGVLVAVRLLLTRPRRAAAALDPAVRLWARLRRRAFDPEWAARHVRVAEQCRVALQGGGWRRPVVGSVLNLGADLACLLLLFVAAGTVPSAAVLVAGWVLPQLLRSMAFFVPGGIGLVEGGMAVFYEGFGVPAQVAVVVILLYRALSFWLPTFAGIPLAVYFERGAERRGQGQRPGSVR